MKKILTIVLALIGLTFMALAIYYFATPAGSLAHWVPGYIAGSAHKHTKHGMAAFILGLGAWVLAWFSLGAKADSTHKEV